MLEELAATAPPFVLMMHGLRFPPTPFLRAAGEERDSVAPQWRMAIPDSLTTQFLTSREQQSSPAFWSDRLLLGKCIMKQGAYQVHLSPLFWATQDKDTQLAFRATATSSTDDFVNFDVHYLCARCNKWLPASNYLSHLPITELYRFLFASVHNSFEVPETTNTCKLYLTFPYSREEANFWYQHHLRAPDWPTFCPKCNCLQMHSFLPLRNTSVLYCKQATLAKDVSLGYLTACRFIDYPGHPLLHLYSIGKWALATLLRLRKQDRADIWQLFEEYHRALALIVLFRDLEINASIVLAILDFLPASFRHVGSSFCSYTVTLTNELANHHRIDKQSFQPVLEAIVDLALAQKHCLARKLLCFYAKKRLLIRYTDRLGLVV